MCGVEIELEGYPVKIEGAIHTLCNGIVLPASVSAHHDGSLRNGPIEFVTTPCRGKDLISNLDVIQATATTLKLKTSNRAGVHIHVDCQQLRPENVMNILKLYTLLEPIVFAQVARHRSGSLYCKSWFEGTDNAELANALTQLDSGMAWRMRSRYHGLNINSLLKHGTLEWRHLQSTYNSKDIVSWINFITRIYNHAQNLPPITDEMVVNMTPDSLVRSVFGSSYVTVPYDYPSQFWQNCVPLWFELFGPPAPVSTLSWDRSAPPKVHPGYTKFISRKK